MLKPVQWQMPSLPENRNRRHRELRKKRTLDSDHRCGLDFDFKHKKGMMKNYFRNLDVFDEFDDDEPIRLQTRRKRQPESFDETDNRIKTSRKQHPRDVRKRKSRGNQWENWIN